MAARRAPTTNAGREERSSLASKRKVNRFNLKIVLLELKALYPGLSAEMDEETRVETERTLRGCIAKLGRIADFFAKSWKLSPAAARTAIPETTNSEATHD
jgi:hypothetical protein